mmetsp:Transcript_14237/g.26866  ORF Transcript_14237/g.26866 Transcript_14237/m.26866 type:complete len:470 (-) Transcript_14237:4707-6116(-)
MHYSTIYDRGHLTALNPQLNYSPGTLPAGVKRYPMHKNMQSTGVANTSSDFYLKQYQDQLATLKAQRDEPNAAELAAFYGDDNTQANPYRRQVGVTAQPNPPKSEPVMRAQYEPPQGYEQPNEGNYRDARVQEQTYEDYAQAPRGNESNDELSRLREELARKEAELQAIKQDHNSKPKVSPSKHDLYIRFNKDQWDRQVNQESKLTNLSALNMQMEEKKSAFHMDRLMKEHESAKRLDDLRRMREEELHSRMEKINKEKEYRDHLNMQAKLRQQINKAENFYQRATLAPEQVSPPPPPRFMSMPPPNPKNEFDKNVNEFYASPNTSPFLAVPRLTKKAPKTICFNPITGGLKDTSVYLFGNPSPVAPAKHRENPFVPIAKNQYRVPSDFSVHPAFQQPRFTKMNPKLQVSNPITGEANKLIHTEEFQESLAKFYGVDELVKRDASRTSLAEYGNMILQANGRNPAWSDN